MPDLIQEVPAVPIFGVKVQVTEITFHGGPNDGGMIRLFYLPNVMFIDSLAVEGRVHQYVRWPESTQYIYKGATNETNRVRD